MFGRLLLLLMIALPLLEIGLFVVIGQAIGLVPTLLGVIVAAIAGGLVLRWQGFPVSAAVLCGELAVLGAITVALAAVLVWRGDPEPGGRVAPILGLAGVTALIAEPLLNASIFLAADGGDGTARLAWSAAGLLAVTVTLVASRDPASRWRR